jgi:uncharacterized membrane protein
MNNLQDNLEFASFVTGLIGLITLIVFFIMSKNISSIRKTLEGMNTDKPIGYANAFNMGELREFQGKKQEALDCYMESLFLLNKFIKNSVTNGIDITKENENGKKIKSKIIELGGTVPEIK